MPLWNAISWTSRGIWRKSTNIPLTLAIHTSGFASNNFGTDHFGSSW